MALVRSGHLITLIKCHKDDKFLKKNTKTQEGIFPDWEDEKNGPGGRWIINSDRCSSSDFDFSLLVSIRQQRGDVLDTHWLEILIFLIGEQAEVLKILANRTLFLLQIR